MAYDRKYYENNREAIIARVSEYKHISPEVDILASAKRRAKDKKLPFDINLKHIRKIWPRDNFCPALGIKFKRGEGKQIKSSPTLDRIIPELGYTKDNVQILSSLANRIKTTATPDQVLEVAYFLKKTVDKASLESIIEILKTIDERTIL